MNSRSIKVSENSKPLKTGEILVKEGFINPSDIDKVLSIQKKQKQTLGVKKQQFFGMILCDLNLITPVSNYSTLYKHGKIVSLRYYLIIKNIVLPKDIKLTVDEAKDLNMPFYALFEKKNIISKKLLQKLLFELYHIPYRRVGNLIFQKDNRSDLSLIIKKEDALEHRMLPLAIKGSQILIGITGAENLLFINKLDFKFPHFRFKAVFIPFSGFLWFFKSLYSEVFPAKQLPKPKTEPAPDLSLLLSFKTILSNPFEEQNKIKALYKRYELLRSLTGHTGKENRLDLFEQFVIKSFQDICSDYNCNTIEFFLKKENPQVRIGALPKLE